MRVFLIVLTVLFLSSCATGYAQFYQAYPDSGRTLERRATPAPQVPTAERASGNVQDIFATYLRRGYNALGYSHFNSGAAESDNGAIAQGAKIGADLVVIVDPRYTDTQSGAIPITTPKTTTSYTTGTATAYGPSGTTTAYGNATTTTYGSQTAYVPYSVDRFDYGAIYFVRTRFQFGAFFRDLTTDERQELQSNKGVVVTIIVDGSPAYDADFLEGDMILAINGKPVGGGESMADALLRHKGQLVTMSVMRNGTILSKAVTLRD